MSMKYGVVFPQTEFGNDPAAIRDFAQAVEGAGYDHLLIFDHVLGADGNRTDRPRGPYTHETPFHEPFVLFGFFAAVTTRIELVTGVLILPQRQTALVAKQAAEVDVLSGGRLRLGVGTGWNKVEYDGLGMDFHTRGKREEEQIELMRKLWTEDVVRFEGKWDQIDDANILPRPTRSIPIWFGGKQESVLKRAARMGDGWIVNTIPGEELTDAVGRLDGYLAENGRSRAEFGLEGMPAYLDGDLDRAGRQLEAWKELGTTHVSVNLMKAGITSPAGYIEALERWKTVTV